MKKIIAGLFAIAAFTFSANAQTNNNTNDQRNWHKDRQDNHQGHEGKGMRGLEKLNLTEAQKQQMKSINQDFKSKMQALNSNGNLMVKDAKAQRQALVEERKTKIAAILTPEQKTQFDQLATQQGKYDGRGEGRMGENGSDRMEKFKSLGLTDDQKAKIKAANESYRQREQAIRNNQSLSDDQRRQQMETLRKEKEANLKSYLTADQIAKFEQMKGNKGDWKNKDKGDGYKEKRKTSDGKEKIKVKTT